MTLKSKVFQNGRSQAIRIPKEFRVDTDEVYIEKVGEVLIIKQIKEDKWEKFFENLQSTDTTGFLEDREQLSLQEREIF